MLRPSRCAVGAHSVYLSGSSSKSGGGPSLLQHSGCGELGQTSPDGKFTVVEVECLGACGFATPIMINNEFVESVAPESVPRILSELA